MFDRFDQETYKVGDAIYLMMPEGWNAYTAQRWTVIKKTATGRISASRNNETISITPRGTIVGEGAYGRRNVCSEAKAVELIAERKVRLAWGMLANAGDLIEKAARRQDDAALEKAMASLASAIEARRAATLDAVHESAGPQDDAQGDPA